MESDQTAATVAKLEQKIDEIVRSAAERIVPPIGRKAVSDTLEGLLPDALRIAVDEWRKSPLRLQVAILRTFAVEGAPGTHSPIPRRATGGSSGYDVVYCPPTGVTALQLRAQPAVPHPGVSVNAKGHVTIYPNSAALLPTGFAVAIPAGFEAQIRSRSGLATRGIVVDNSPGTIDSDYRFEVQSFSGTAPQMKAANPQPKPAEVKVLLRNHGFESIEFKPGDRIAQIVFVEVQEGDLEEVPAEKWAETVGESDRVGGFGSTGI